jgi:hypothetical protein
MQTTPKERAAGLVIGSGGLPYILARIGVSKLVVADLHASVIASTLSRVSQLADHTNWWSYNAAVARSIDDERDQGRFRGEVRRAREVGLMASYALTREGFSTTDVQGVHGNIVRTAPDIASEFDGAGTELTFINVTNAAHYSAGKCAPKELGRQVLWQAISTLPLAEDLIIIDSSADSLTPRVYSPEGYLAGRAIE